MKLRTKIMLIALFPVFILGISAYILSANRTASGIYDEAYNGMHAAALAVRDIFEIGNPGPYATDEKGDLWKGETLNISQSSAIVDHIKDKTGMDVTVFWGDTRILTSITDASGQQQIGTQAPSAITNKVLYGGEYYLDHNVEILGTEYIACYVPFFQDGTNQPVGMVFLGKPQETVQVIIKKIRLELLLAIAAVLAVTAAIVTILVNRIVSAMGKSMGLLQQISEGDLAVQVDPQLLKRPDEVGMLGKEILQLRNKLQVIIDVLKNKSANLDVASASLKEHSQTILELMKGIDQSSQELSVSCISQADDAATAGSSVTQMVEMINTNILEIRKMHEISSQIQNMSKQTAAELMELNNEMKRVRTSIEYLSHQTTLTKESADNISTATELIAAVASQTSLLSLNASIEAARAGDLGKGFGVVASEIQNLSVQANSSVDDIRKMVETLTENSSHAMKRMEEVRTIIKSQENSIQKAGQVFENVKSGILESVSHMDIILSKSDTMDQVRTEMVSIVQNSAETAQENAASIQEMMAVLESAYEEIQTLSEQTGKLTELSEQMKESVAVFNMEEL